MGKTKLRRGWLIVLVCIWQVVSSFSLSITPPVDVFTGRPFTLGCKITRPAGDRSPLFWDRVTDQAISRIYFSRVCTSSIPASSASPAGLSGGCEHVNGEEVYKVTVENVTENMDRSIWACQFGSMVANVTLDVQVLSVNGLSIMAPDNVVAGRPFTLECKKTGTTGDRSYLFWYRDVGQFSLRIYATRVCNASIPLSPSSPAGMSGGCQHVNGEEVYTLTIENVTEDTGRGIWRCQYGARSLGVTLNIKVMVTQVTLRNPPDAVLAGDPSTFTCVTSASKPPPCIRGYIRTFGNVRELNPNGCYQDPSLLQTTTRILTFTASAEENGAELYCNASNSVTDPPVRSPVYILNVQYTPRITCQQSSVSVFQGQRVKIVCNVTANPVARVTWVDSGHGINHTFTTTGDPNRHDATLSTSEFETPKTSSGVYQVEATNRAGSSRTEVQISVIEGQYIPKNMKVMSCSKNQATLVWASGLDDSLVEYYKLEYKGTEEIWKGELVRNPGKVKLVETTLTDLQSGVLYQFRLQPNSDIALSEYATTECTVEKKDNSPDAGLSKGGMFGVGVATGILIIALVGVFVICWLRRKATPPKSNKGDGEVNQQATDQGTRAAHARVEEQMTDTELPTTGHYEDLDTSANPGAPYEVLTDRLSSPSEPPGNSLYENATAL